MNLPLVKSIDPVVVDPMTGRQAIVYFHCESYMINEDAVFKDQLGKVTFFVTITELIGDKYIKILTLPMNPIAAEYKFSTFMSVLAPVLFLDSDVSAYLIRKAQLMVDQIDFNSSLYMDLTSNKLQIINYAAN